VNKDVYIYVTATAERQPNGGNHALHCRWGMDAQKAPSIG